MRNMSFMLTTEQIRNKTKTVTRRLGWWFLHGGDLVMACVKCQGLAKGETIEKIRPIEIVSAWAQKLNKITKEEVVREGFPEMSRMDFIDMFCREMGTPPDVMVNRIEFRYLSEQEEAAIMKVEELL